MKHIRVLAFVTAVSAMAGGVNASTYTLEYKGHTAGGTANVQKVTSDPYAATGNFRATGFNMEKTSGGDGLLSNFVAWCLDLGAEIVNNTQLNYQITSDPFSNSFGLSSGTKNLVQNLFDANYGHDGWGEDGFSVGSARNAAGFQIALWTAVYNLPTVEINDNTFWTATNADFRVSSNTNNLNDARTYLNNALSYQGERVWTLTYLESTDTNPRRQNLVTATPIPLPATGLLMIAVMGLGGIGVMAKRRREKSA